MAIVVNMEGMEEEENRGSIEETEDIWERKNYGYRVYKEYANVNGLLKFLKSEGFEVEYKKEIRSLEDEDVFRRTMCKHRKGEEYDDDITNEPYVVGSHYGVVIKRINQRYKLFIDRLEYEENNVNMSRLVEFLGKLNIHLSEEDKYYIEKTPKGKEDRKWTKEVTTNSGNSDFLTDIYKYHVIVCRRNDGMYDVRIDGITKENEHNRQLPQSYQKKGTIDCCIF